jgi:hypothetical protein
MDEIKIKAMIDAADSAKTIQELKKALRDLKSAAVEVGESSQYFEQITSAAGGVSDRIGDLNAQVKNLGDDLFKLKGVIQIGQGIAAGFAIAQGAAALFGSENEAVQQSIMKVQAAMGILQGVQAVGEILQKESAATLVLQNTYRAIKVALLGKETAATVTNAAATEASAIASGADAVAKTAEAGATTAATIAQEELNIAMKANPVMLVVGAIVAAVAALFAFTTGSNEASEATKALNKSLNDMRLNAEIEQKTFEASIKALKAMKTGSEERAIAIKAINDQYGTTLKNLTDEKEFLKQVNTEVLNYNTYAKARLTVKINEARAENYLKLAQEERYKITQKQKDIDLIRAKQQAAQNANNLVLAEQMRQQEQVLQAELNTVKKVALGYEAKAEKVLEVNGNLLAKETAAQKVAREKEQADADAARKKEEDARNKASQKKIEDNKKTNDKLLADQEKFAQDWTDVENEIYQINVDIAEENRIALGDTLKSRLQAIKDTAQQEIDAEKQKYEEILAKHIDTEKKKNDAEVEAKVKGVKKKTDAEIRAEVEKNGKLVQLRTTMATREGIILKNSLSEQEKITKEEEKKRQENIKKLTEQSLSTDEYRRFMDYLALVRTGAKITEKELKSLRKELEDVVIKGTGDKPAINQVITRQLVVGIERDRMLIKQQIDDANKIIEDSKDNPALAEYVKQTAEQLKKLEVEYDNINEFGPQMERFINQFNILPGRVDAYQNALDQIINANKEYKRSAESVLLPDNISAQIDRLFAFDRKVNEKGIDESKAALTQLAVIYKSKYATIQNSEKAITEALKEEFDMQADLMAQALLDIASGNNEQGEVLNSLTGPDLQSAEKYMQEQFGALGPIYVRELKKMVDKAEADAKKQGVEFNLDTFLEGVGTGKVVEIKAPEFKIQPNSKKSEIGFEDIVKIDTGDIKQATEALLTDLKTQYEKTVQAESSSYDAYLYGIFRKQEQELILAGDNEGKKKKIKEKYAKEVEVAEMNHQENILGIDVAFGLKGQEELAKATERRRQYIETEHQKEVERKYAIIQKIVDLEKMAADLVLQVVQQGYAAEDRLSQERYQKRIDAIDEEQKAYDDSLANRTAAEQQALDIQEEFDLRRTQAEDERRREQNSIAEKQFKAQQNNALAQLAIEYGVAIAKAFSTFGWPAGIIPASWLAGQLILQGALIKTQEFVPSFATGGLVTGPGGPKDDKVKANLSNGESVINAKSTAMFGPLLSAINQAGGGVPIPNLKSGGIIMPPDGNIQNVSVVNSSSAVVSLDQSSIQAIGNAMSSQQITVQENTISNAQEKQAKVERRTKF